MSQPTKWMRSRIGETPKGKRDVPTVMEGKTGSRDKTEKEKTRGGQRSEKSFGTKTFKKWGRKWEWMRAASDAPKGCEEEMSGGWEEMHAWSETPRTRALSACTPRNWSGLLPLPGPPTHCLR